MNGNFTEFHLIYPRVNGFCHCRDTLTLFFGGVLKGEGVLGRGSDLGPPREVSFVHSTPQEGLGGSVTCVSRALATPCDCRREHTEWDKLFIMLENSQMREGMLLQATDDVLRGELQRLRAELGRLAGSLARPCAPPAPAEARLARALDELLQASRDAGRRLARLERAGTPRPEEAGRALGAVLEELRRTRADLRAVQGWAAGRWLPAGKDAERIAAPHPPPPLCPRNARGGKPSGRPLGPASAGTHTRLFLRHAHRPHTHHTRREN